MPRPRFDKLPPHKRNGILDAAEAEFATRGLSSASYNGIIAAAGMSKGAAYYYFDDKSDLFGAVVRRRFTGLAEAIADATATVHGVQSASAFWSALVALSRQLMLFFESEPRRFELARVVVFAGGADPRPSIVDELTAAARAYTDTVLATGQKVGAVRTDLDRGLLTELALAVGQTADQWAAGQIANAVEEFSLDEFGTQAIGLFMRLLEPAPSSDGATPPPRLG